MFKHIYLNYIKILVRDKNVVFWILFFPIVLSMFFKLAFSELLNGESFEIISIAAIEEQGFGENSIYKAIFDSMSDTFDCKYVTSKEASKMLDDEEVSGYIYENDNGIGMTVSDNGLEATILKEVLDVINDAKIYSDPMKYSSQEELQKSLDKLNIKEFITNNEISDKEQDATVGYFYSVFGMVAMYGSMIGIFLINGIKANKTPEGIRFDISPVNRFKGFGAAYLAGATIHSLVLFVIYLFIRYALKINFGDRYGLIILTTIVGGFVGISIGTLISSLVKKSANMQIAIAMAVSMSGAFLSGMMDSSIKYKVMQSAPIVSKLNPAGLITDAYLKLYYYDDLSIYFQNILILILMTICFMAITIISLRRQRYDSI